MDRGGVRVASHADEMSKNERIIRFSIGAAFPSADPAARYVMRLAMATGDLSLAADAFIKRGDELADFERFYYVRLLASHLRETVMLIDPPTRSVVPSVKGHQESPLVAS